MDKWIEKKQNLVKIEHLRGKNNSMIEGIILWTNFKPSIVKKIYIGIDKDNKKVKE